MFLWMISRRKVLTTSILSAKGKGAHNPGPRVVREDSNDRENVLDRRARSVRHAIIGGADIAYTIRTHRPAVQGQPQLW
jgi:hypothetical protein